MPDALPSYPAYKDSGVPWLGSIPAHWEVLPNRAVFSEIKERNHPDADMLSVTIAKGVIRQRSLLEDSTKRDSSNLDKTTYKLVQHGDIAYNKMRAWQGAIGMSEYEGIVSPAYVVQRTRIDADSRYLHFLLRTPAFAKEAERWSYGITSDMWSLRPEHCRLIYICLPHLPEQHAITRYLDHIDRRIRRTIRARQKLIALLEEQKQAVIHQAVTRGLDPSVRLKPSGVAWLGDVPEHWDVWSIGRFARVGNGSTPLRGNSSYWVNGTFPWLNSSFANQNEVVQADQFVTSVALQECHLPIVTPGSVLVAITGQGKTRGKASLLSIEATINQHLAYITPKTTVASGGYVRLSLAAAYAQLRAISDDSGSTKGALTCADLKRFKLVLPPVVEQESIIAAVENGTQLLIDAIDRAQREIALLREYRTRLIADVVTGQVDVRAAAAQLPQEAEEMDALAEVEELAEDEQGEEQLDVEEETDG